jgi:hypothetical protein
MVHPLSQPRWIVALLLLLLVSLFGQFVFLHPTRYLPIRLFSQHHLTTLPLFLTQNNTSVLASNTRLSEGTPPYHNHSSLENRSHNEDLQYRDDDVFYYANSVNWAVPYFQTLFRKHRNEPSNCDELCLRKATVPFYVYPERWLFSDRRYDITNLSNNKIDRDPDIRPAIYRDGASYEIAMLHALENHSMRTESYDDAKLFVIPIALGAMFFDKPTIFQKGILFNEIQNNLASLLPFQQGKPHVVVSMTTPLFNPYVKRMVGRRLNLLYAALKNVTVARTDDYIACHYAYRYNATPNGNFHGFEEQFSTMLPLTEYQFSVGLGDETKYLPLMTPTWDKFQNSTFFIFYHTRTSSSMCNSTVYRHAPVLNVSLDALPQSSIGWGIRPDQWKQEFSDSKFCLVIRGDNPQSHALFNAVKVGCIPVIVSDWFLFFAPPFPTTLDLQDFCIFIPEDYFLTNTERALQRLQDIPDHVIKAKLKALKWAQRVMLLEHPQSLFVPAFIREAVASFSRPASQLLG